METLSSQEKMVLEIMRESEQQLTPEEIMAEIKKRHGQIWPIQITMTLLARLKKLGYA